MKRVLYCIFTLAALGCGYSNTSIPDEAANGSNQNLNVGNESLNFALIKSQVFQGYCLRCHSQAAGNKGGVNLEVYTNVQPIVQTIFSAVSSGFMPQTGTLPASMKALLLNWIQVGAPEFATSNPTNPNNPTPIPTPTPCDDHGHHGGGNQDRGGDDCPIGISTFNEGN